MKLRRIAAIMLCAAFSTAVAVPMITPNKVKAEEKTMEILIDGLKANTAQNMLFRGNGMVTGNGSSRLLLDYKYENPQAYQEIMEYTFGESGIGINHLKIEMGSDINSSSGTEPSVKRTEDEAADVTRGAGYIIAADAKKINPDLTLDMLWWSEPLWISSSDDVYAARYKWYKETLDAVYDTYGLMFDYVSATQNERAIDAEWIKYLSAHLKNETDCRYDYSKIKIVAADEVCGWGIADKMLVDEELLNAVDVLGSHYTSWSSFNAQKVANNFDKELWFSEGSASMSYSQGTYRFDGTGSGLSDMNGILDIANRFITMYSGGQMTLCQYQPVISAYYDGVTYCHKQFITANEPWSGYYSLDNGFYMSLHFSQFIKKGWAFIDDACYGDGKAGGDGHCIVDATYSYMTATDTKTGDYSTVITNTTAYPITYKISVSNLEKASSQVGVWETRGPDSDVYNENYFKKIDTITPDANGSYSITIKPYSLVTISTLDYQGYDYATEYNQKQILALPYSDDFEYADYDENYLASRGYAPRYTTDQGGAFEVQKTADGNVLTQIITPETKAKEWGGTPDPTTNFGDDRWNNYSIEADIKFAPSDKPDTNYAGAGVRYNLACNGASGYWLQVYENGYWKLNKHNGFLADGTIADFDSTGWHNIKVEACLNVVNAYVDGTLVHEYTCKKSESLITAGRAALFSSYNQNSFDNLQLAPVQNYDTYITKYDNTDICCDYTGSWDHATMSSFRNYKRTISTGSENAVVAVTFDGTGAALAGATEQGSIISVKLDGEVIENAITVPKTDSREVSYYVTGLENKSHTLEITVVSGTYSIDLVEVTGENVIVTSKEEILDADDDNNNDITSDENSSSENIKSKIPVIAGIAGGVIAVGAAAAVAVKVKKNNK